MGEGEWRVEYTVGDGFGSNVGGIRGRRDIKLDSTGSSGRQHFEEKVWRRLGIMGQ